MLVGLGTALRLDLPGGLDDSRLDRPGDATSWPRSAATTAWRRAPPRSAPVLAFGALPFERDRPATLVVPDDPLLPRSRTGPSGSPWWPDPTTTPTSSPRRSPGPTGGHAPMARPGRADAATRRPIVPRDGDAGFEEAGWPTGGGRHRTGAGGQGGAGPTGGGHPRPGPDVAGSAPALGRPRAQLHPVLLPTPTGSSSGPAPSCWSSVRGTTVRADRWPAPPTATPRPGARSRAHCSSRPRTPRSTAWWWRSSATPSGPWVRPTRRARPPRARPPPQPHPPRHVHRGHAAAWSRTERCRPRSPWSPCCTRPRRWAACPGGRRWS